jgi:hypothetical protein
VSGIKCNGRKRLTHDVDSSDLDCWGLGCWSTGTVALIAATGWIFDGVIAVSTHSRHTVARVEGAGANLIYDAHDAAGLGLGKAVLTCLGGERSENPEPR